MNSSNGSILNEVVNAVATVYQWKDFYKPIVKRPVAIADSLISKYIGTYFIGGDTLTIVKEAGLNYISFNPEEKFRIYFTSVDEFFSKEIDLEFKIEKDASGKITGFYFLQGQRKIMVKRL